MPSEESENTISSIGQESMTLGSIAQVPAKKFKLGRHEGGQGIVEHRHGNLAHPTTRKGKAVWLIAPSDGHLDLLLTVAAKFASPLRFRYVLLVAMDGWKEGRYTHRQLLSHQNLSELLLPYADFLEQDARHHIIVESDSGSDGIIYDQHNFLYLYGDGNSPVNQELVSRFKEGHAEMPSPHSHHYHEEFDMDLMGLLGADVWDYSELTEED
jgi:hypothetical protein